MKINFILTACNQKSIISCDIRRLVLVHVVHHVHVVTLSWKCIVRSHGREYDRRETKSPKHPCMERCNYFFYDHFLLCCMCLLFYNVHLSSCDVLKDKVTTCTWCTTCTNTNLRMSQLMMDFWLQAVKIKLLYMYYMY
jgi:hypothetical protein